MQDDSQTLTARAWLQQVIQDHQTTPAGLAAITGVAQSSLSRFLRGEADDMAPKSWARIVEHARIAPPVELRKRLDRTHAPLRLYDMGHVTKVSIRDGIPVWGVIPKQPDGEFELNPIPLTTLRTPPGLTGSSKIVAFYMPDETMAPRWVAGEPVLVDLARPGPVGSVVLLKLAASPNDPNESETHLVRQYDGRRGGNLIASTLNGDAGPVAISLNRVLEVRHVLSWADLLT